MKQTMIKQMKGESGGKRTMRMRVLFLPLLLILVAGLAQAVTIGTFLEPSACGTSDTISGTQKFNVSVTGVLDADGNITNVTFEYQETGHSAWVLIGNASDGGPFGNASGSNWTITFNTLSLSDNTTYSIKGTIHSGGAIGANTSILATVTQTSCYPDNTNPTCTFGTGLSSGSTYNPTQQWKVSAKNATGITLLIGNDRGKIKSMTKLATESETWSYTGTSGFPVEGIYNVIATSSDSIDSTACTTLTSVKFDKEAAAVEIAVIMAGAQGQKQTMAIPPTGGISITYIGLIGLAVILYMRSKKK